MPAVMFVGQSAQDGDNKAANTSRLINCYREPIGDGKYGIKSVLGMSDFATLDGLFLRAMARIGGVLYAVHGGKLWSVDSVGSATELGDIPDSDETTISGNNGAVTVCADGRYFVWDTTLTEPATGAFSDMGSVTFMNNFTLITEKDGRRVQWSAAADATSLPGLEFATTESRDDNNIRAMPFGGELWVFKQQSIERWYNDSATGDFQNIPGSTIDKGLKGFNLVTAVDTGGFFIGEDNKAYICGAGGIMTPVSTPAVETSLANDSPLTAFYYQDEGHEFCVVTFAARPAWVYDISMMEWHERAEGASGEWTAVAAVNAYGGFIVGTNLGAVNRLERTNVDNTGALIRTMQSTTGSMEGNRQRVSKLTFNARTGYYDNPTLMMEVSRDRGQTWGAPKTRTLGAIGHYETQIVYRALGSFRNFTVRLSLSDPVEVPIEATAYMDVA